MEENTTKNYGLKFDEIKPEDWKFGSNLPVEVLQEDGDWTSFLPMKEFQNLNNVEPYACVTFTVLNCIEILIRQQYGEERNYSDRFLASISGTNEDGNSPQRVCQTLKNSGVVLQDVWPFNQNIDTFEKFYEKIPQDIIDMAKEFLDEWEFKHEYVGLDNESIAQALKCSPLLISVSAWFERGGKYYRPKGMKDNHATTLFSQKPEKFRRIFDTYEFPYIKDLEWAIPQVVKRFYIKKKPKVKKSFWEVIHNFFLSLLNKFRNI